jgi:hypothetical protein
LQEDHQREGAGEHTYGDDGYGCVRHFVEIAEGEDLPANLRQLSALDYIMLNWPR